MSQSSYSIPNQARSSYRAAVNTALQALASVNSGATAPAETYAYMLWADTANDRLKIRNAANNAWIEVAVLSTGNPAAAATAASQAEMEAGTEAAIRLMSPLRVKQAIDALTPDGIAVATQAEAEAGTNNTTAITPLRLRQGLRATGDAPVYAARAWANFNGSAADNKTGTYSQSGTTVTVTITAHGYETGQSVYLDITSGTAVDGIFDVTRTGADTFTVQQASRTTSGNVTAVRNSIRASGNVSSVSDNGVGEYTINFATAMPDANYTLVGTCAAGSGGAATNVTTVAFRSALAAPLTTSSARIICGINGAASDQEFVSVAVFR